VSKLKTYDGPDFGSMDFEEKLPEPEETETEETKEKRGHIDLPFFLLTILILGIGLIMVFSASFARAYYETGNAFRVFIRQAAFSVGGIALMIVFSRFPMRLYRRYSKILMYVAIGLLVVVLFIGTTVNGAKRWIDIKIVNVQPSEIAKIAVILYFSVLSCKNRKRIRSFRYGIVPFAVYLLIISFLLYLEPHNSAIIIIVILGGIMMFAGGSDLKQLVACLVAAVLAIWLLLKLRDYSSSRILAWQDPFSQIREGGWQIVQSLYAIGSGGLLGLGLGQGRQKYMYLPEEHNDFIFSIVCEELGFIGASLILILFAILILRGYWLAVRSQRRFDSLVIIGITSLLALQVILNVAVVTNLIPTTGISLPFFSYGGSALLIQMGEMGIVLSASRDIPEK
jgi:cell division protein FtsW